MGLVEFLLLIKFMCISLFTIYDEIGAEVLKNFYLLVDTGEVALMTICTLGATTSDIFSKEYF